MDILAARRRMGRKLTREDKKKAKAVANATRRCRQKKKNIKEEAQAIQAATGPSLYDNLMRLVILAY